MTHFTGQPG